MSSIFKAILQLLEIKWYPVVLLPSFFDVVDTNSSLNIDMSSFVYGAFREPQFDPEPFVPDKEEKTNNGCGSQES